MFSEVQDPVKPQTFGIRGISTFFDSLNNLAGNGVEKIESVFSTLIKFKKEAYRTGDYALFAFIIKRTVDFCITAFSANEADKIASVLGLSHKEVENILDVLRKRGYPALAFLLVNNDELEKFSEMLDKDKKEIQPFRNQIYEALLEYHLDGRPTPNTLKLLEEKLDSLEDTKEIVDIFFGSEYIHGLVSGTLNYLYFNNQFKEFSKLLFSICKVLAKALADPKVQLDLLCYFELDKKELELLKILWQKNDLNLLMRIFVKFILGDIARENNLDMKSICEFEAVLKEAETLVGASMQTIIPEDFFNELFTLIKTQDRAESIHKLLEFYPFFTEYFAENNVVGFSQFLVEFAKYFMAQSYEPSDFKLFSLAFEFNRDESREFERMILSRNPVLMTFYLLEGLNVDNEAVGLNMQPEALIPFKTEVIAEVTKILGVKRDFFTPGLELADRAKKLLASSLDSEEVKSAEESLESQKNKAFLDLILEVRLQLKMAYQTKNAEQYANLIKNAVDVIEYARLHKQLETLMTNAKVLPHFMGKMAELSSDELYVPELLQLVADFFLKRNIKGHYFQSNEYLPEFYKTRAAITKARTLIENGQIEFQKAVYQNLGLPNSEEKLGSVLYRPYFMPSLNFSDEEPSTNPETIELIRNFILEPTAPFQQLFDLIKKVNAQLRCAFAGEKPKEFTELLCGMKSLLLSFHEKCEPEKIAYCLNELRRGYSCEDSNKGRVLPLEDFAFIMDLIKKLPEDLEYSRLLNFALLDQIDFKYLAFYQVDKCDDISRFKGEVLRQLNEETPIKIDEEDILLQRLESIQKAENSQNSLELSEFLQGWLQTQTRYLLLEYFNNNLGGESEREITRSFTKRLLKMIEFGQNFFNIAIAETQNPLLRLWAENNCALLILKPESRGLFAWIILNFLKLDEFFGANGISRERVNQFKSTIYTMVDPHEEILRKPPELGKHIQRRIDDHEFDYLLLRNAEAMCLLLEYFRTLDAPHFAKTSIQIVDFLKTYSQNTVVLAKLIGAEEAQVLFRLWSSNKSELVLRYFVEICKLDHFHRTHQWQISPQQYVEFLKSTFSHFKKEEAKDIFEEMAVDVSQKSLSHTQKTCFTVEVGFSLQDAYIFNDATRFSEIIQGLTGLVKRLYDGGQKNVLIQLFELDSENAYFSENFSIVANPQGLGSEARSEDFFKNLAANNLSGFKKLLIDSLIDKYRMKAGGDVTGITPFKQSVYDTLGIIPLDLCNLGEFHIQKDKELLVDSLRKLANQDVNLDVYEDKIGHFARLKPIMDILPAPQDEDTKAYRDLYQKMHKIWQEHLLVHRFAIMDSVLEGSCSVTMVQELQSSFANLSAKGKFVEVLAESQKQLPDVTDEQWKQVVESIQSDMKAIILLEDPSQESPVSDLNKTFSSQVRLRSDCGSEESWGHGAGFTAFKFRGVAYCSISDRGGVITEHSGHTIHKMTRPENFTSAVVDLTKTLKIYEGSLTVAQFKEFTHSLSLEECHKIRHKQQKSGNCGWSSEAKMLAYMIIFVNILKTLEKTDLTEEQAFFLAEKITRPIYKIFTSEDRVESLEKYFQYCAHFQQVPNGEALAQIYLKMEHRQQQPHCKKIIDLLSEQKAASEQEKIKAYAALQDAMMKLILSKAKFEHALKVEDAVLKELAQPVLDAYLTHIDEKEFEEFLENSVKTLREKHADLSLQKDLPPPIMHSREGRKIVNPSVTSKPDDDEVRVSRLAALQQ